MLLRRWAPQSLAARIVLLLGIVACVVSGALGSYFYVMSSRATMTHLDRQLVGRVEHFRRLVANAGTIIDLQDRPILFETMLGNEDDVLLLRMPGQKPFILVNPSRFDVPSIPAKPAGTRLTTFDVQKEMLADGTPMHWAAVIQPSGRDGQPIEIVAGHRLLNETRMIRGNRDRLLLGALAAVALSTLLGWLVLHRGLRPLRLVAESAADIHPLNLDVRLAVEDAPREVQHLVTAVNEMLDRIASGYQRLSQFSADLAHEIRTPIGALIGQTQVALQRPRSVEQYEELLESNLEELDRLRQTTQNMLFLAQADNDTLDVERTSLSVESELRKSAEYFEGLAEERELQFEIEAQGQVQVQVVPALFRRAINNLVLNAVRYSLPRGVVRLAGRTAPDATVISVENMAEVIPDEQLTRLFDRFFRGDTARSHATESNGLGLAIVKAIMEQHGGSARVSCSQAGRISFELSFPLRA